MFEKIMEYEVPPRPEVKVDDFEGGITTRLMAKRYSGSDDDRRKSLTFPPGSFVPNSNILLSRRESIVQEEDSKSTSISGITVSNLVAYREDNSEEGTVSDTPYSSESPLQKMRESVRRRSRSNSRNSVSLQGFAANEAEKSFKRVSMRTSALKVAEVRKPSPESLRNSIDNSDQGVELLDVDELVNVDPKAYRGRNSRVSFQKGGRKGSIVLSDQPPS